MTDTLHGQPTHLLRIGLVGLDHLILLLQALDNVILTTVNTMTHRLIATNLDHREGGCSIARESLDDHERRQQVLLVDVVEHLHEIRLAIVFFRGKVRQRFHPEVAIGRAILLADIKDFYSK